MRVGVEVGGTFTDLVAVGAGELVITKVPSVSSAPDVGAFRALTESGLAFAGITDLAHGSTVATNAVLERKGARIALIATRGFRDILLLQRHDRRSIYDLAYRKPEPLVARRDIFEVGERILADGSVLTELDPAELDRLIRAHLRPGAYEAVAIALLNSYANPAHEHRVAEIVRAGLPGLPVTCSADVAREFREYERTSTTVLATYVQPVIAGYLARFQARLAEAGFTGRLSVMQSNGGLMPAEGMGLNAVTALFSGPAAGVMGATRLAGLSGYRDLITFDMGGTSTDICLVENGRPGLASETEIDGLPARTPVLDIVTVGAGGGSIVWADDGGMLRVGPRSAGADPGPACYGRGGTAATVTDAHVIRGTIRPTAFLGGAMAIDAGAARLALTGLGRQFERAVETLADDAIRLAEANIVRAIQLVSTERGRDPRDYALVPFGGAGPLHAVRIAEALGVETILVPPCAGVISAYGLLAADYAYYDSATRRAELEEGVEATVRQAFAEMCERAERRLAEVGLSGTPSLDLVADMRFVGQAFEVPVALPVERIDRLTAAEIRTLFEAAHERLYRHGSGAGKRVEIVAFRLGAHLPSAALPPLKPPAGRFAAGNATVVEGGRRFDCPIRARATFAAGARVDGPLLIEDSTSTVYVPDGWRGTIDEHFNLILGRSP
ncbi:MAG: hydantoinase/oxoprolinase family protein [Alphaproteobacteria bacterium]|nr:hydantoinase/oxoprolinase family protein [Alphaproteobacteria bacterium]